MGVSADVNQARLRNGPVLAGRFVSVAQLARLGFARFVYRELPRYTIGLYILYEMQLS